MNEKSLVPGRWLMAAATVLMLMALPLAAACGDDDSPESDLCNGLEDLGLAIKEIQDIEAGSAREDLQRIRTDVQEALSDIQAAASEIPEVQAVQTEIDSFRSAVEGLGSDVSPGQAIRTLGSQIVSLSATVSDARAAVDC